MELIPYVKVAPSHFVLYNQTDTYRFREHSTPPKFNKSRGFISLKAQSRIRNAVQLLVFMSKPKRVYNEKLKKHFLFRVNFITLTLSSKQIHSDNEIKQKLLQPFIRVIKSKYGVRNYIWKAETQSNDNIHFHITLDQFIHWRELRDTWNIIQENLGYVTRSKIMDPNSTDIHSVKNIHSLAAYLSKYLSKNQEGRRLVEGKLWDCNKELKLINTNREIIFEIDRELRKVVLEGGETYNSEYHTVIKLNKYKQLRNYPALYKILQEEILKHYQRN